MTFFTRPVEVVCIYSTVYDPAVSGSNVSLPDTVNVRADEAVGKVYPLPTATVVGPFVGTQPSAKVMGKRYAVCFMRTIPEPPEPPKRVDELPVEPL